MPARPTRPLALLALALALLAALAQNTPAPVARAAPREPATTPLASGLSVDGYLYGFTPAGDTLYAHGDFSYIGERVRWLTVLDADGRIPADLPRGDAPLAFGYAHQIIPDGAGGWFIRGASQGSFTPTAIHRLDASLRPLPGWPVSADAQINAIDLAGGTLYVAGKFDRIGGQARPGLAALDIATGALLPWIAPVHGDFTGLAVDAGRVYAASDISGLVAIYGIPRDNGPGGWSTAVRSSYSLIGQTLVVDDGRLYVGGAVYSAGADRVDYTADDARGLVVLDSANGAELGPWVQASDALGYATGVYHLAVSADTIFLTGTFSSVNGQPRAGFAAVDRDSGALRPWRFDLTTKERSSGADTPSAGSALALDGDTLYLSGIFDAVGGQPRRNLAAFDASSGALLPWRGSANQYIYRVGAAGGRVAIGGDFTLAGGSPGADAAAIDAASGRARVWEPRQTSTRDTRQFSFGANSSTIFPTAALGDYVYLNPLRPNSQGLTSTLALHRASATIQPWRGPADAAGTIAAGAGALLIGRAGTSTTAIVAAYDPLGTTPRWERSVAADTVQELLIAGGTVYGVASGAGAEPNTYGGSVFALRLADGALLWERPVGGRPVTLALAGEALYIGGAFQSVGDLPRVNLAALDAASGAALPWPAELAPNNLVADLAVDTGRLYLSGIFTAVGASARPYVAAIDLGGSPGLAAWTPVIPPQTPGIIGLAITDSALYLATFQSDGVGGSTPGYYGGLVFPLSPSTPTSTSTATSTSAATAAGSPTATTTSSPTVTATPSATGSPTATTTSSPTVTAMPSATGSPTATSTTGATAEPPSPTITATPTTTATTTKTATASSSPTATRTPTRTATPTATASATSGPTSSPTRTPTATTTATQPTPAHRVHLPLLRR